MKIIFMILFAIFCLDSFCQQDSIQISVGDIKNVTGYLLEYSKDKITWGSVKTLTIVKDTGLYKYNSVPLAYGYYRVKALGVNEYSKVVNYYNPLPVSLTNYSLQSQGLNDVLRWTSNNEINIKKYVISRSSDGVHFTYVTEVTATGNGNYQKIIHK